VAVPVAAATASMAVSVTFASVTMAVL
jgi:hypothetical protein